MTISYNLHFLAVLDVYTGFPPVTITFQGDYDSYLQSGTLEILRATIYNYLVLIIKLPITSDIVLRKGLLNSELIFFFKCHLIYRNFQEVS